ncbi:MAG: hypothetical protein EP343_24385 [Deltaproteobacteria bacterium]|nr:MAG: hypothetical protein EP343_24385 [Deltaproteobacteria bacterium]
MRQSLFLELLFRVIDGGDDVGGETVDEVVHRCRWQPGEPQRPAYTSQRPSPEDVLGKWLFFLIRCVGSSLPEQEALRHRQGHMVILVHVDIGHQAIPDPEVLLG